jgi:hypothetical protein
MGDLEGICKECVQGVVKEAIGAEDDDVDVGREVLGRGRVRVVVGLRVRLGGRTIRWLMV